MSHNTLISNLHTTTDKILSPQSLTLRLNDTLSKYHKISKQNKTDLERSREIKKLLGKVIEEQKLQEKLLEETPVTVTISSMIEGVKSFDIYPSGSSDRYLSKLGKRSDSEAIDSDWKSVGNDLKAAWAKVVLQRMEQNVKK